MKEIKREKEISLILENVGNIERDLLKLKKEGHLKYMHSCELVFNPITKTVEGYSTIKYARREGMIPLKPYISLLSKSSRDIIKAFYNDPEFG